MDHEGRAGSILVPVDFSDIARAALTAAAERVEGSGGSLILLHVLHEPAHRPGFYQNGGVRRDGLVPREQQAERMMAAFLDDLRAERPDLRCLSRPRILIVAGLPATRIVAVAAREGVDRIIMGHREHTRFRRVLWGSVVEAVKQHASVPVTLVAESTLPGPALSSRRVTA